MGGEDSKLIPQPPAVGLLKTLGARRMGWEEFPGSDPEIGMRTTAQRSGTLRYFTAVITPSDCRNQTLPSSGNGPSVRHS